MQYASVITQFAGSFGKYVTSQCLASSRQVYWVIWSRDQLIKDSLPSVVWFYRTILGGRISWSWKVSKCSSDSLAGDRIHGSGGEGHCKEDASVQTGLKLVYIQLWFEQLFVKCQYFLGGVYSGLGHSFSCFLWSSWWYDATWLQIPVIDTRLYSI